MTEMGGTVDAGRLSMDAYVDTTGMVRGLQRRIDRDMRTIRANIKAEIQTRGILTEARRAARAAQDAAKVSFRAEIDTRALIPAARAAAAAASAAATVKIRTDIDLAGAEAALAMVSRDRRVEIKADADTAGAEAQIEAVRREAQRNPINMSLNFGRGNATTQIGTMLMQASKIPAMVGGIYTLGTAAVGAAGGLFSMASAGSQALGVLAAIPNLAGTAAQGLAAVMIGFSGVGPAVSALSKQQETAAATAQQMGDAQRSAARGVADAKRAVEDARRGIADANRGVAQAARGIADAQRAVADAQRGVGDARRALADAVQQAAEGARSSAEAIADAERRVQETQRDSRQAQVDLNEARAEAIEYIQDIRRELRASRSEELGAANALQTARERLMDVQFDASSTARERRDAEQAVRDASDSLAEARDKRADLATEVAKANKTGVEGTDIMLRAREAARDAALAEQDAERGLVQTRRDAAQQQRADAARIADAQRGVADAHRQVASAERGVADARRAMADAQRRVADAERAYVDAQRGVKRAQDDAASSALTQAAATTAAATALDKLSPAGQRFARFLFGLQPRWLVLRNAVQGALLPPIQRGVEAALPMLGTLRVGLVDTAFRIGTAFETLGRNMGTDQTRFDVSQIMASNNRALGSFLDGIGGLFVAMRNVAVVAGPTLVEPFARWIEALGKAAAGAAEAGRASGGMAAFFERAKRRATQLKDIVGNLVGALFGMGKAAVPAGDSLLTTFQRVTQQWSDFANSDAGQAKMRQFFDAVKPVTIEVGRLVANIGEFLAAAGGTGAGPAVAFFKTLNVLVQGLTDFMNLGGGTVGKVIGYLMALAGIGGALGFVAGVILKMAGGIITLLKFTLSIGRAFLWFGRALGTVGRFLMPVFRFLAGGVKVFGMLGRAIFAIGRFLLPVLRILGFTSPIGLLITGITLVVGALILAYKKFEWFRKGVDKVWGVIVDGAQWVWDKLFGHSIIPDILDGFRDHFGWIAKIVRVGIAKVRGFIDGLRKWAGRTWKRAWAGFKLWMTNPLQAAKNLFDNTIGRNGTIRRLMNNLKDWAGRTWKRGWKALRDWFSNPLDAARKFFNRILGRGGTIRNILSAIHIWATVTWKRKWAAFKKTITKPIEDARDLIGKILGPNGGVRRAFSGAVKAIASIWKGLPNGVKAPIRGMLGLVNTWVIDKFNWVSKKFNGPEISRINVERLAEGGPVPGRSPHSRADNIPILATAREFMIRQKSAERLRKSAPGFLEYVNKHGEPPPGHYGMYAKGGRILGGMGGAISGAVVRGVQRLAKGGSVWPTVGRTVHRSAYNLGHNGVDINQPPGPDSGAPIYAWRSGRISYAGWGRGYGHAIMQKAAGFPEVVYGHASRVAVRTGQQVSAGQQIGNVGATGNAQGAHLHFGRTSGGTFYNAMSLLQGAGRATGGTTGDQGLFGKAMSWLGSLGGKIRGALSKPLDWLQGQIKGPVAALRSRFSNPFGQMLTGIPERLVKSAAAAVTRGVAKKEAAYVPPGMGPGASTAGGTSGLGGPAARRAAAAIRAWGFGGTIYGYSPRSGKHGEGKALDLMTYNNAGLGNKIANYFYRNRAKFGVDNIIWRQRITNAGRGWPWPGNMMEDRGSPTANHMDHPHVDFYDRGGSLYPGSTLAINRSGKTETVFTNDNMVEMASGLSTAIMALRDIANRTGGGVGAGSPLVENLTLVGRPQEMPDMLRDATHQLRVIRQGGVYAKRTP